MAATAQSPAAQYVSSQEELDAIRSDRVPFPLLARPATYDCNTFDYCTARDDLPQRSDWIEIFRQSVAGFRKTTEKDEAVPADTREQKAREFEERANRCFDALLEDPDADLPGFGRGRVCCKRLCHIRDTCLRDAGFWDAYQAIKATENDKALALLPGVLQELDAVEDDAERIGKAVRGVFAGNIFDLGAPDLAARYEAGGDGGEMFNQAKKQLLERPWAVDRYDALLERLTSSPAHTKAMVFCDNAGADFVLGLLPFARELLKRGTAVVIAANAVASINDMTAAEARDAVAVAAAGDGVLREKVAAGEMRVVSSGNDLPMIDLKEVGRECAAEAAGVDLVVLEGMGRGIETNLYAEFSVDSLKLAMVKHREVAQSLGGRMYDCVCQFLPAARVEE